MLESHYKLKELVEIERKTLGEIIRHLEIINNNRIFLKLGYKSIIDYCIQALGYSESAAYRRKAALRLIKKSRKVLKKLENGDLTLAKACDLNKNIEEKESLLGKPLSKEKTDELLNIAANNGTKDASDKCRETLDLPVEMKTLTIEVTEENFQKWVEFKGIHAAKRLTDEGLLMYALDKSSQEKETRGYRKATPRRSKNPRYITAQLKRKIKKKANYQCQSPGCNSKYALEIDHIKPISKGGTSAMENLQLLCRNHNQLKGNKMP